MNIHILQHDELVQACTIEQWALDHNISMTTTFTKETPLWPEMNSFDFLIILGGRMGAYDDSIHPWLQSEKAFISQAIRNEKYVLGICLGAQLLATVLGGKAYPHSTQEVGWWPVSFKNTTGTLLEGLENEIPLFQFHGDTFSLPTEAIQLAESLATEQQAFIYGERIAAVQFHPEIERNALQKIIAVVGDSFGSGPFVQPSNAYIEQTALFEQSKAIMYTLLDNYYNAFQNAKKGIAST